MRSLYSLLVSKHLNMLERGFTIMCCQLLVSSERERDIEKLLLKRPCQMLLEMLNSHVYGCLMVGC